MIFNQNNKSKKKILTKLFKKKISSNKNIKKLIHNCKFLKQAVKLIITLNGKFSKLKNLKLS